MHAFIISGDGQRDTLVVLWPSMFAYFVSSQTTMDLSSKWNGEWGLKKDTEACPLAFLSICTHMQVIHTHIKHVHKIRGNCESCFFELQYARELESLMHHEDVHYQSTWKQLQKET